MKSRKEYLADMKNQAETIQLFIDTERKLGSSTKKKSKGTTKKRDKSAPLNSDVVEVEGSGDFSLQALSTPSLAKSETLVGLAEEASPSIDESKELRELEEQFSMANLQRTSGDSSSKQNNTGRQNVPDIEKDLEVEDFY